MPPKKSNKSVSNTITRSLSFTPEVLAALDAHVEKHRSDRSTVNNAVLAHVLGLRQCPAIFRDPVPFRPDLVKAWGAGAVIYKAEAVTGKRDTAEGMSP